MNDFTEAQLLGMLRTARGMHRPGASLAWSGAQAELVCHLAGLLPLEAFQPLVLDAITHQVSVDIAMQGIREAMRALPSVAQAMALAQAGMPDEDPEPGSDLAAGYSPADLRLLVYTAGELWVMIDGADPDDVLTSGQREALDKAADLFRAAQEDEDPPLDEAAP